MEVPRKKKRKQLCRMFKTFFPLKKSNKKTEKIKFFDFRHKNKRNSNIFREGIMVPYCRHVGNLNFTYHDGLRCRSRMSTSAMAIVEGAEVDEVNPNPLTCLLQLVYYGPPLPTGCLSRRGLPRLLQHHPK